MLAGWVAGGTCAARPAWTNSVVREVTMALRATRVDTWAATIEDRPGGLAAKLAALAAAKVNLEFVIARRAPDKPGTGVVFVTPIKGASQVKAAQRAGFTKTTALHTVRIQGPDKAGAGARIASALAEAGLNVRGFSAAAIGRTFVGHVALDTPADAAKAGRVLAKL